MFCKKTAIIIVLIFIISLPAYADVSISGIIRDIDSQPVADVLIFIDNPPDSTITNPDGYYEFTVPDNWSGTVTPSRDQWGFTPQSQLYENLQTDQTDQDYLMAQPVIAVYTGTPISIHQKMIGAVTISVSDVGEYLTDDMGFIQFTVPYGWSGSISALKDRWTFDPPNDTYTNCITSDSINFTGTYHFRAGQGTTEDPYQIADANDLYGLSKDNTSWDDCFIMTHDIDLTTTPQIQLTPIGDTYSTPFIGCFDGNGYTISGLSYNTTEHSFYIALFGNIQKIYSESPFIKNLGLIDPVIYAPNADVVAALAGSCNESTIENCYVSGGSVEGHDYAGTIVGLGLTLQLTNCYATTSVTGNDMVGGLVGYDKFNPVVFQKCYYQGTVTGNDYVGGLIGYHQNDSSLVSNCYAQGTVTGHQHVGGLIGWASQNTGTIANSYSTCLVDGDLNAGGLIGNSYYIDLIVISSYWDIQTSNQTQSAGGEGKTTADMMKIQTYVDWDFTNNPDDGEEDIWRLCQDDVTYPQLAWQTYAWGDFVCPDGTEINDLDVLLDEWLTPPPHKYDIYPGAPDSKVNLADFQILAQYWLTTP